MNIRKKVLSPLTMAAGIALLFSAQGHAQELSINKGPFKPTEESLKEYKYPDWFRDAKFGIWAMQ